jgi:hypothetical protein
VAVPPPRPDSVADIEQAKRENTAFIRELVEGTPGLEPVYREHLADNYGELLPHMLMGDFTRWFIDQCRLAAEVQGTTAERATLRRVARFLDATYQTGPPYVRELLVVSFLENLHLAGRDYELVKSFLAPTLRSELDRLEEAVR